MRTIAATDIETPLDIEALQTLLQDHSVKLAILFGSHATGDVHSESDVDLAVEFSSQRPSDPHYNETFLGLSADISHALGTNDVDLVDLHTVSPALASSVFDTGILLVGDEKHASELREELTAGEADRQTPRDRFDSALARIDTHLDGDSSAVPVAGDSDGNG